MSNQELGLATRVMVMTIVISVTLLFLGIGVLVLIHVCIVRRAFRRGFGNGSAVERGSFGNGSISQGDVEKLPCFDFKARETGSSSPVDICAVCLENFKVGDKCRLLPVCKHSFHAQCVDLWLVKSPICPICRTTTESGRFGERGADDELRESQTGDSGRLSEIAVELREGQTRESDHLSEAGVTLNHLV